MSEFFRLEGVWGAIFLAEFLLFLVLVFLIRMAWRVRCLSQDLAQIQAKGEASLRVAEAGSDEVAKIASAINAMLEALEKNQRERLRLQEQFEKALRLQMIHTLTAGIAHEINNALNILQLNLSHLDMRIAAGAIQDPAEMTTAIRRATTQAQRIAEILTRMRMLVRQTFDHPLSRVDVGAIASEALLSLDPSPAERKIAVTLTIEKEENPPLALASPLELRQILSHLLLNACEALSSQPHPADSPPPTISIRLNTDESHVHITVEDNGPGFGEYVSRVFDPFFTTKIGANLGLGLAIAESLVLRWGGTISASNRSEGGAAVRVSLRKG